MNVGIRTKNVGKKETFSRIVIGLVLIGLAFLFPGIVAWILGFIGVALLLTAFFRY